MQPQQQRAVVFLGARRKSVLAASVRLYKGDSELGAKLRVHGRTKGNAIVQISAGYPDHVVATAQDFSRFDWVTAGDVIQMGGYQDVKGKIAQRRFLSSSFTWLNHCAGDLAVCVVATSKAAFAKEIFRCSRPMKLFSANFQDLLFDLLPGNLLCFIVSLDRFSVRRLP